MGLGLGLCLVGRVWVEMFVSLYAGVLNSACVIVKEWVGNEEYKKGKKSVCRLTFLSTFLTLIMSSVR